MVAFHCRAAQPLILIGDFRPDDRLDVFLQLIGRRERPEHFEIADLFVYLEEREQRIGRDDLVDLEQQPQDVLFPVLDHLGGDDEFFQEPEFEFEDFAIHRDVLDPFCELAEFEQNRVEFEKPVSEMLKSFSLVKSLTLFISLTFS